MKHKGPEGPNRWSVNRSQLIQLRLGIGEYEMLPSNKPEGFTLRLFQLLPALYSHRCSLQREGGFLMSEFTALSIFQAEKALPGNIRNAAALQSTGGGPNGPIWESSA